jgi:uncharacterized protein (DUF1697 family)
VGGRTVRMDRLRGIFEEMGFAGVTTFIASGNVIFESAAGDDADLERRIETALRDDLGFAVDTFLRTVADLRSVLDAVPWPADQLSSPGHTLFVAFTRSAPAAPQVDRLHALANPVDVLSVSGREVYWLRKGAGADSKIDGGRLERALASPATVRNITTIRRMAERFG